MRASRAFHRPWATAPTDDEAFDAYLVDSRRADFEAMLVCRREDRAILGFFNLSHITRGSLQSAYLGYAVSSKYAGQGYMREGLDLVVREAFLTLRLHRIEANIQPGNQASIALARGAGFHREGFSPRYLKIGGRWRDHERWAILAEDWREHQGEPRAADRALSSPDGARAGAGTLARTHADVAQLVEHFTRNEGVPGSSPGVGFHEMPAIRAISV